MFQLNDGSSNTGVESSSQHQCWLLLWVLLCQVPLRVLLHCVLLYSVMMLALMGVLMQVLP